MVLEDATLVLNKRWYPIDFTTVKRAITLLYCDSAAAIHPKDYSVHNFDSWSDLSVRSDEQRIVTVNLEIKVPEIIVLKQYGGVPSKHVVLTRRNLFRRDNYQCQYCGVKLKGEDATIDHIIPRSRGGKTTWTNCVVACLKCNTKKGNRKPADSNLNLMADPIEPTWTPCIKIPFFKKKVSWEKFISDAYWNVELEA